MRLLDLAPKRKQQMIIFTVSLASFMGALDSTIVNISLPTISRYFDMSLGLVSWVLLIYLLFMSSFLLAFGKLGDIIGFRKVLIWGFAVFSLGSFLCGITPSFELLLAFRVIQAIGGAMLISLGPAVVTTMLPPEIHGRALGYVGTLFSLGIALGPVLGGYLTAYLSWRWIFFVNVPIGLIALLGGMLVLPQQRETRREVPFDMAGAALIFVALGTMIYALNMGTKLGWTSPPILCSLIVCLLSGSAFLFREERYPAPLLNLNLFRNPDFTYANGATFLIRAAASGAIYLFPFYLEFVKDLRVETSGLILLVFSLATMVAGPVAGMISDRFGSHRICVLASLLAVVAFGLFSTLGGPSSIQFIVISLALGGVAVGTFVPPNSSLIMGQSPPNEQGMASSVMMTVRNIGSALGIALFGAAALATLHVSKLADEGALHNISPDILPKLLTPAFHNAFLLGILLCLIAVVLSLMAKDRVDATS